PTHHLVNAKSSANENTLGGQADNPHFWSAPAQGYNNVCDNPIGGSSGITKICQINLNEDCTGSNPSNAVNPHPWVASCAPASPYDLSSQSLSASTKWWGAQGASLGIDKGYPSTLDLRAACDHFVLAGLTVVDPHQVFVPGRLTLSLRYSTRFSRTIWALVPTTGRYTLAATPWARLEMTPTSSLTRSITAVSAQAYFPPTS